ncbi:MAG: hypothetical protein AAGF12_36645 [Myxococcota bacterium]
MSDESKARVLVPLAVAAIAVVIGRFIGLPGVNTEELQALMALTSWVVLPPVSVIGVTLPTLVCVQLILIGARAETRGYRIGASIYLVLSAVQGLALALFFENADAEYLGEGLVSSHGWGFRLLVASAVTGGAALTWILARWIDRTETCWGAPYLFLVWTVIAYAEASINQGLALGLGASPLGTMAPWLLAPVTLFALGVALYIWPVKRWPILEARFPIRSPLDVIAVANCGLVLTAFAQGRFGTPTPTAYAVGGFAVATLGVGLAVVLAKSATKTKESRSWGALAFGFGFLSVTLMLMGVGFVESGGVGRMTADGPLRGELDFDLTLDAEGEFLPDEPAAMEARLEALGADADASIESLTTIQLKVRNASSREAVLSALEPVTLGIYAMHDLFEARPELMDELELETRFGDRPGQPRSGEGECALVREWLTENNDDDACRYRIEVEDESSESENRCALHCLAGEPVLTSSDIEEATVTYSPYDNRPTVLVTLDAEGARKFGDATSENVHRPIAIVVGRKVVSAPVVNEPIYGGSLQISLGGMLAPDEAEREARMLAERLHSPHRTVTRFRAR